MSEIDGVALATALSEIDAKALLPDDGYAGALIGRVWDPKADGPSPVAITEGGVFGLSHAYPTVSELLEQDFPARALRAALAHATPLIDLDSLISATREGDATKPNLLSPVDLQAVKAAGVTFAASTMERVIEERAKGDLTAAAEIRGRITAELGVDIAQITPGSERATKLKQSLLKEGLWSQYLEVGLGPDAEIFTKAQPLSTVGALSKVGILSSSEWNNPEPEVVLAIDSEGRVVGATLGNDVNLRDIEGRSALLLPKAKDNNASCALGPFIRLFDDSFGIEDVRQMTVTLAVQGEDGFTLNDSSDMGRISRDPLDLVSQLIGPQHQYPDGAVLMLGTMFAPVVDRDAPGHGFTHHRGDVVTIASPALGSLTNVAEDSELCAPWQFGAAWLMRNLARRGLL
jgi:fumarylacetoacetate (FAA) hydrolase family protein